MPTCLCHSSFASTSADPHLLTSAVPADGAGGQTAVEPVQIEDACQVLPISCILLCLRIAVLCIC